MLNWVGPGYFLSWTYSPLSSLLSPLTVSTQHGLTTPVLLWVLNFGAGTGFANLWMTRNATLPFFLFTEKVGLTEMTG